ncbi:MAG: hypothetical protein BWY70_01323 [Bacteroidetes bacterium ADurb.Bin408]|nr:MAG: hypothetical protein BWY70_01323 [Bacteroidetes bacterium ADurb.Bin408]
MKKLIVFLIFSVFINIAISCSSSEKNDKFELSPTSGIISNESAAVNDETAALEEGKSKQEQNAVTIMPEQRKLIKTGQMKFETDNMDETRARINQAVSKHNAYISNEQAGTEYDRVTNTLVIRVNAQNFDNLVNDIGNGVEKFDTKTIDVNDVTEEYVDIQSRLKTKKELENRYLELLKKAVKVSEMLEIEQQIGYLRTEIESIEGRMRYMNDRIEFSTLTVTFYKKTEIHKTKYSSLFARGFMNGINALIWFFIGLVNIWPFILLTFVTIWLIRRHIRRKRNKKNLMQ